MACLLDEVRVHQSGTRRTIIQQSRWLLTICGLIIVAIIGVVLAYQRPVHTRMLANGLGDQFFLGSTEALNREADAAGLLFPDELYGNDYRFRWTRERVHLAFAGLGGGRAYTVTALVQGWPDDVLRQDMHQPTVQVIANGIATENWTIEPGIHSYTATTTPIGGADLILDWQLSGVFTGTAQYPTDLRPHGLRLFAVSIDSVDAGWTRPAIRVLWQVAAAVALLGLGLSRRRSLRELLLIGGILIVGMIGLVGWWRIWAAPTLLLLLPALLLCTLWTWRYSLGRWLFTWRERALSSGAVATGVIGATLIGVGVAVLPWVWRFGIAAWPRLRSFDPATIIEVFLTLNLLTLLALRWTRVAYMFSRANRWLILRPRLGAGLLGLVLLIWLGYLLSVVLNLPYLGNADYSDNGVVARNLVAGRGWVVDYVTQFYTLNAGGSVTRVQETWPLMQPVWIAPFFALFGPTAWAAKLPNLLFLAALSLLVYHIAARVWDRRVGLVAVVLVLLNQHYFRLAIYATSDLAFVVFYVAALWLLWRWGEGARLEARGDRGHQAAGSGHQATGDSHRSSFRSHRSSFIIHHSSLLLSGLLLGLMCLQKPSGVIIAAGMGLWALWQIWRTDGDRRWRSVGRLALGWVLPALLMFSPYLVRNMIEFGTPVFSTESYDAWILEYQGTSSGDFESIYKVMTTEGGLEGSDQKGLPEPSWIKRWGYQRTLNKVVRQFKAVRDYLLPATVALGPFSGKGAIMGNYDNGSTDPTRWLMAGSWLSLVGLLTLRRQRARLYGLVLWSFVPYTIFLATYWHANEERYFVPLVPWLALLAAAALWAIYDVLARAWRGRGAPLALLVLAILLVLAVQPGWIEARNKTSTAPTSEYTKWQTDLQAFDWLRRNTPADSVVMTRVPWQLNFHAQRPAVMNPNTSDMTTLLRIARYYNARYLLVNAITNNKDEAAVALGGLLRGEERDGFERAAVIDGLDGRTIYIYRFPRDYNDVQPIR